MKSRRIALGALIAVIVSGTAYGGLTQGTTPTPPTSPPTQGHMGAGHKGRKSEPHPEMIKGKRQLQTAKATLQKAARDYDGHRVKAIGLIDQAIKEIDAGIASDRK